jgi:hypothetical protein
VSGAASTKSRPIIAEDTGGPYYSDTVQRLGAQEDRTEFNTLIKNGVVVDGSGKLAFSADVRVRGGLIAEIAPNLAPNGNERIVDAAACYVTPGFIKAHNHWDAAVWWSPNMEPFPGYGVTTSINGNCGFSLAPLPRTEIGRDDIVEIFNFFEDIPEVPMKTMVPWDWHTWSEYKASHERKVRTPVNFAAFCGHIPLRLVVMGEPAWERMGTHGHAARDRAHVRTARRCAERRRHGAFIEPARPRQARPAAADAARRRRDSPVRSCVRCKRPALVTSLTEG